MIFKNPSKYFVTDFYDINSTKQYQCYMIIITLMALTDELNQSLINTAENIGNLRSVKIQIKITSNHIELTLYVRYVIQRKTVENLPE